MPPRNLLLRAPPYQVEHALKSLGGNLRLARLRRNLTIEEVAEKIGVGRRVIADAEKGKPTTGIANYIALLWTYSLLDKVLDVLDPAKDEEGQLLARAHERLHAYHPRKLRNDF